jgi:UrcA family protein
MVRKLLASTAILFTLGLGTAVAGPTTIAYGDLNLATPTGSAALAARVQTAAAAYCAPTGFADRHIVAPAFAVAASKACIKQVSGLALTEIHAATGTPVVVARN